MKTSYHIDPYSIQPNNMHILQVNPSVAINLGDGDDYGWLFEAEAQRQEDWVKIRKLSGRDLDAAKDQVADMGVWDAGGALPASVAKKEEPAPAVSDPQKELLAKLFRSRPEAPPSLVVRAPGK